MLISRDSFLKKTAAVGAAIMLPDSLLRISGALEAADLPHLVVAKGKSDLVHPEKIVQSAVNSLGGMKRFISIGDVVVVKPNMAWDRTPEFAANTNPDVVAALVKMCFDAGAKKVKVFDHGVNDMRRCYRQSGIQEAAARFGADVTFIDERKFKDIKIGGNSLKSWPFYTEIFEADKVINVPVAKHHSKSKLTMAMKNWMGVIGGKRSKLHWSIDESLVDLSRVIKPTLTVLDAVRILTGNGPQGGSLAYVKRLNTIVVSTDQVAVDAFGTSFFGMRGEDLGYVKLAADEKMGVMDLSRIKIERIQVS